MALRTRPFKFTLWKVANVQKRTCRASIQRSASIEENDNRQKVPSRLEELLKRIASTSDSTEHRNLAENKDSDAFSLQKDVAPRSLALFLGEHHRRLATLCLEGSQVIKKGKCDNEDFDLSKRLPNNSDSYCDDVPTTGCDKLFGPYLQTADDILVGRENTEVMTSKKSIDPRLAAEFFSCRRLFSQQWESMEGMLAEIAANAEANSRLGLTGKPADADIPRQLSDRKPGNYIDYEMPHNLGYHIDNCLNGFFALEGPTQQESYFLNSLTDSESRPIKQSYASRSMPGIVYCDDNSGKSSSEGSGNVRKPNIDQLRNMHDYLEKTIPKIFVHRHDYRIYRRDVIFENNFTDPPKTTIGVNSYALQVAKLRLGAHFQYANVRLNLLKSTMHEDEGCIRFSWRITGIPQTRAFMFWKFLPWSYKAGKYSESESREGISTFYLDGDGIIAKHQMDQFIQDKEPATKEELSKLSSLAV